MKLIDLFEQDEERVTGRLGPEEFELAYNKLAQNEMSKEEIRDFAREMVESGRYPRSANSLIFLLSRMHIILHGVAPEGETQNRADVMFRDTKPIIDYVIQRGDLDMEDIEQNIGDAKEELASRPIIRKVKKEEALRMMSEYYKANKERIPRNIQQYREQIVQAIMNGVSPEQAFAQFM